ncbi:hypothetical protein F5890DRAFT_269605 [Lentinula detonsa]|uniref:Uncharacterized protein n=1 Tax=Lentinula detonsa TaxID=2804962 RepID=A0AA38PWJ2_9AGAR|nr:hypothetical protein F5890DRAFT_269605 [Lentinula detonsa]
MIRGTYSDKIQPRTITLSQHFMGSQQKLFDQYNVGGVFCLRYLDIRKFDAERLLCAIWIPINHEDHLQTVQTWLHHGECVKRAAAVLDQDQTVAVAVGLANMSFVLAVCILPV